MKDRLGANVHYPKPIPDNKMYKDIEHKKDNLFIAKSVCDTVLTLPIHPYMKKDEVNKIINTILIFLEHENSKFVNNMKRVLGEDLFDKNLINETTEDIYDYIIEKSYQLPSYIEDVSFNNKQKLKIAFNKFYYKNIE